MLTTTHRTRVIGLVLPMLCAVAVSLVAPALPAQAASPDPVVCWQGSQLTPPLDYPTAPVASCTLTAPTAGNLVIVASAGFLPGPSGSAVARVSLGVDGAELPRTGQYASTPTNGNDGADANAGPVAMTRVQAGSHTVELKVSKQEDNAVKVTRSHIWALFVPDGSPYQACSSDPNTYDGPAGAGSADQVITSCTLTTSVTSKLVVLGSGSLARSDGEYEARTGLGIDGPPDSASNRWTNTYASPRQHAAVNTQLVREVQPGAHTVTLQSAFVSGSGHLVMFRPNLVALAVPTGSSGLQVCSSASSTWQSSSTTATTVTTCGLAAGSTGDVLTLASASAGVATSGGAYEASFGLSLDGGSPPVGTSRWLDVDADTGDGQDATQVSSAAFAVQPGAHTFAHTGALSQGSGPARLYRASLVGIFVPTAAPWTPPTSAPPTTTPTPTPTTPTPTPTTTPAPAPTPEAQLVGAKVKVAATLRLAKGAKGCPAKATVTVRKGRTTLATAKLRARAVGTSGCRVSGTVTLSSRPSATAKLKLAITGQGLKARTIKVTRG